MSPHFELSGPNTDVPPSALTLNVQVVVDEPSPKNSVFYSRLLAETARLEIVPSPRCNFYWFQTENSGTSEGDYGAT